MRNLKRFPIKTIEIEEALLIEAKKLSEEGHIGDMRPILFRAAARIISRIEFVTYKLEG